MASSLDPLLLAVLQERSAEPSGTSKPHPCAGMGSLGEGAESARGAFMWSLGSPRLSLDLFIYLLSLELPSLRAHPQPVEKRREFCRMVPAAAERLKHILRDGAGGGGVSIPLAKSSARVTPHPPECSCPRASPISWLHARGGEGSSGSVGVGSGLAQSSPAAI